jgi:DNA-3-methyladenine glycosylase II
MLGEFAEDKGAIVGIAAEDLRISLDELAGREPRIAAALEAAGYPEPRISAPGYETLLRAIVGQQVSVKAAASMWAKLTALVGDPPEPAALISASDETLRAAGLSRQKASYARSLAEEVVSGRLDFAYLLFAEGRTDIWPAGDLAVQIETGRIMGLDGKPTEKKVRELAEAWRPHRGAFAIFAWHHRRNSAAPV